MMDAPVQYDSVLINIQQVVVEVDTATTQSAPDNPSQWDNDWCGCRPWSFQQIRYLGYAQHHSRVYNLLALRNGTDTLLTSSLITTGKILKIQILLGSG